VWQASVRELAAAASDAGVCVRGCVCVQAATAAKAGRAWNLMEMLRLDVVGGRGGGEGAALNAGAGEDRFWVQRVQLRGGQGEGEW
jgi:hypothetical protein